MVTAVAFDFFGPFELRTLFRLLFITHVVACVMLLVYRQHGAERALVHRFIAARMLQALGCLLIGFRGELSPWLSINLANSLMYFGFALEILTIVALRTRGVGLAPVTLAVATAGSLAITFVAATPGQLVGVAGLTVAALFAPAAVVLARGASRLQWTMAVFFLALAVTFLLRAYAGFLQQRSVLDNNMLQMLGLIVMYAYAVAGGVGFLLLMKEQDEQQLRIAATTDALTGILNRRSFFDAAGAAITEATASGRPLALLLLDVDHFKRINDTYGHPVGDLVLQQLAASIARCARSADIFGRLGGEEFALLLRDAGDGDGVLAAAERIRAAVQALAVPSAPELACSVSIGCALIVPGEPANIDHTIRCCDEALYAAKRGGRNRVVLASRGHAAAEVDAL